MPQSRRDAERILICSIANCSCSLVDTTVALYAHFKSPATRRSSSPCAEVYLSSSAVLHGTWVWYLCGPAPRPLPHRNTKQDIQWHYRPYIGICLCQPRLPGLACPVSVLHLPRIVLQCSSSQRPDRVVRLWRLTARGVPDSLVLRKESKYAWEMERCRLGSYSLSRVC